MAQNVIYTRHAYANTRRHSKYGFSCFLYNQDVEELAKGGSMDGTSTSKKSKGLFGDMSDVFGALSGGAHIVKREDGTV